MAAILSGLVASLWRLRRLPLLAPVSVRHGAASVALVAFLLAPGVVLAAPTPVNRTLSWEHEGTGIAGFWAYFAPQGTPGYSDARRVQIPDPTVRSIAILDLTPATGSLCFVVTAYDAQGAESAYSNEACGWFGLPAPTNAAVQ